MQHRRARFIGFLCLPLLLSAVIAPGETSLGFGFRLLGGDLRLAVAPDPLGGPAGGTVLGLAVGAGYQTASWYRTGDDARFEPGEADRAHTPNPNADLLLGVTQGLVQVGSAGTLSAFLYYRGGLDYYLQNSAGDALLLASGRPDVPWLWHNEALAGLVLDATREAQHPLLARGFYVQASVAASPPWLGNDLLGSTDYQRVSLMAVVLLPPLERRGVWLNGVGRFEADLITGLLRFGKFNTPATEVRWSPFVVSTTQRCISR